MIPAMLVNVLIFLLVLLLALLILLGFVVWAMSSMLLSPDRMDDARATWQLQRLSPGDLGLEFEDVTFHVRDERSGKTIRLAGWWIAGKSREPFTNETDARQPSSAIARPPERCVLILHGFADAKVGAIAWAPLWLSLGFNVLAVDLRAHGESQGRFCTTGIVEQFDIDQVINDIRAARPDWTHEMVLFGISLGASVAACVATRRDDLLALVLDSPYGHFARAAKMHGKFMNVPGEFLAPLGIRLAEWRAGIRYDDAAPISTIPRIKCPVMVVQGEHDPLIPPDDIAAIEEIVRSRADRSVYWRVPETGHVLGIVSNPPEFRSRIEQFLQLARRSLLAADERR